MNKEDYERYKRLDKKNNRNNQCWLFGEQQWYQEAYKQLSPQQKGAIHRLWKRQGEDNDRADMYYSQF